jgi:hypothetical protein
MPGSNYLRVAAILIHNPYTTVARSLLQDRNPRPVNGIRGIAIFGKSAQYAGLICFEIHLNHL